MTSTTLFCDVQYKSLNFFQLLLIIRQKWKMHSFENCSEEKKLECLEKVFLRLHEFEYRNYYFYIKFHKVFENGSLTLLRNVTKMELMKL